MLPAKRRVVVDGIPVSLIEWRIFPPGVVAIAFPTFILIYPNRVDDSYLLEHEFEHVRQWRINGSVKFAFRYLRDYVHGRLRGESHQSAYMNITFEKAARAAAQLAAECDS